MDNLSIFDFEEDKVVKNTINVVNTTFNEVVETSWEDLFEGYTKLYAITYSSGINFLSKLFDKFEYIEVIFGSEAILSNSHLNILAFQNEIIENINSIMSKTQINITKKIKDEKLHLFVAKDITSHQKIFILEDDLGNTKVITGSANLSYNAFTGFQKENINCYNNDVKAYDYYMNQFEDLKTFSTNEIDHLSLKGNLVDNIDKLPFNKEIMTKQIITYDDKQSENDEVTFTLSVQNNINKLKPLMPKEDKKNGEIKITANSIKTLKRQVKIHDDKVKQEQKQFPKLDINVEEKTLILNDKVRNLNPGKEQLLKDVSLFISYMDGFNTFHGNTKDMQYRYFELFNWMFCSPFMAIMRNTASKYNQPILPYPTFGIIYGQSKAGKTSFLETIICMMLGTKTKMDAKEFTRTSIEGLKREVRGLPIIVDDMTQKRFREHAVETIKSDQFGIVDNLNNYPAVIISANEDVKAQPAEIRRRAVVFKVNAGLTNTEIMKSNVVQKVQSNMTTAFFDEYIRRMYNQVPELLDLLSDIDNDKPVDILNISSKVIISILNDLELNIPDYIRELTIEDYFGENITGQDAIELITNTWNKNNKLFEIDVKSNELTVDMKEVYEAANFMKQLPETLVPKRTGSKVIMKLDASKEFFGINFKKTVFDKFKK